MPSRVSQACCRTVVVAGALLSTTRHHPAARLSRPRAGMAAVLGGGGCCLCAQARGKVRLWKCGLLSLQDGADRSWRCTANTKSSGGSVIYTKLFAELGRNKYVPVLQTKVNTTPSKFLLDKLPVVAERDSRRDARRRRRELKGEQLQKERDEARRNGTLGDSSVLGDDNSLEDSASFVTSGGASGATRRRNDYSRRRTGNDGGTTQGDASLSEYFAGDFDESSLIDEEERTRLRQRWAQTQDRFNGIVNAVAEDEKNTLRKDHPLSIETKGLERVRTPSRKAMMSQGNDEPFSPMNDKDPMNFGSVSEDQLIELAR